MRCLVGISPSSLPSFLPRAHPLLVLRHGPFWRLPLHWSESVGPAWRQQLSTDLCGLLDHSVTWGVASPTPRVSSLHQWLSEACRDQHPLRTCWHSLRVFPSPTRPETLGWGPENLFQHGAFFGCRKHLGNHSSTTSSGLLNFIYPHLELLSWLPACDLKKKKAPRGLVLAQNTVATPAPFPTAYLPGSWPAWSCPSIVDPTLITALLSVLVSWLLPSLIL